MLMVLFIAALFLAFTVHVSALVHIIGEIGVLILGYALIGAWVCGNARSLEEDAQRKRAETRQPWDPAWWRPGLNSRQRHYLDFKYRNGGQRPKEPPQ